VRSDSAATASSPSATQTTPHRPVLRARPIRIARAMAPRQRHARADHAPRSQILPADEKRAPLPCDARSAPGSPCGAGTARCHPNRMILLLRLRAGLPLGPRTGSSSLPPPRTPRAEGAPAAGSPARGAHGHPARPSEKLLCARALSPPAPCSEPFPGPRPKPLAWPLPLRSPDNPGTLGTEQRGPGGERVLCGCPGRRWKGPGGPGGYPLLGIAMGAGTAALSESWRGRSAREGPSPPCWSEGPVPPAERAPRRAPGVLPCDPPAHGQAQLDHRAAESGRLAKISEIIQSNHHPNTPTPAKPCPQVPHPHGV